MERQVFWFLTEVYKYTLIWPRWKVMFKTSQSMNYSLSLNKRTHVFGYRILIIIDFFIIFFVFSLVSASIEKIYQTLKTVWPHFQRQRYSATRCIFNSLLGVWRCAQQRSDVSVWYITEKGIQMKRGFPRLTWNEMRNESVLIYKKITSCVTNRKTNFSWKVFAQGSLLRVE